MDEHNIDGAAVCVSGKNASDNDVYVGDQNKRAWLCEDTVDHSVRDAAVCVGEINRIRDRWLCQ